MPERPTVPSVAVTPLGWRAELSGIRAVAMLLVLGAHLGLPLPQGGPVGVTVFFVLSGFLITNLLIEEWDVWGSIRLREFYIRRARRLVPALVVAVAVVAVIALASGRGGAIVRDSILALSYVSNWARADGELLGFWNHTWSLAIEEQFYLLWPLAFVALQRLGPSWSTRTTLVIVAIAVASALTRVVLTGAGATGERVYFGSDTRAEALLVGCALAGLRVRRTWAASAPAWMAPASLAVIGALVMVPDGAMPWAGARFTLVSLASAVLIVAALSSTRGSTWLATRPMVWLGDRSYSLYLWHVPVILALAGPLAGEPPIARIMTMTAISLALAATSYSLVERPFRRSRVATARPAIGPMSIAVERTA